MHRTQIYFDEPLFEAIKQRATSSNLSISAYIREVLQKELESKKNSVEPVDFSDIAGLWQDYDISQESIRKRAWK